MPEAAGIVPRFCYDLFREIEAKKTTGNCSFQIQISKYFFLTSRCYKDNLCLHFLKHRSSPGYFEIYKEKIQDLLLNPLKASCSNASLRVREHPQNVSTIRQSVFVLVILLYIALFRAPMLLTCLNLR